jgi:hypothetical protein
VTPFECFVGGAVAVWAAGREGGWHSVAWWTWRLAACLLPVLGLVKLAGVLP